jgi:hypothetical protein
MAATNFSAVLQCPSYMIGTTLQIDGVTFVAASGTSPDGEPYRQDLYTVSTQKALQRLLGQGWKLVSLTPASLGGNQGW